MKYYFERITSLLAAILFLQTLFYKFTAAQESVYIFSEIGVEPFGRIGAGVFELITAILLVFRKTSFFGAILGLGVISGAIVTHIFIIGVKVLDDGGLLFGLAIVVFILCLITVILQKEKLFSLINKFSK